MIIHFIVGLIKKICLHKISYFLEPFTRSKNKTKVELDLSNYATQFDLRNTTSVDNSDSSKTAGLLSKKSDINELDIDKLKPVPDDFYKPSNVVENEVVKNPV